MRLWDISIGNLKVRKTKMLLLVAGMAVGVATIVTLTAITSAMQAEVARYFRDSGVRLVLAPYAEKLSLAYNGVTVAAGVTVEADALEPEVLDKTRELADSMGIRTIAPKFVTQAQVKDRTMLIAGVDFSAEVAINRYWQVTGRYAEQPDEVVLGYLIAERQGLSAGDTVTVEGQPFKVAGVLAETGDKQDRLIFAPLAMVQRLADKEGTLNMIEVVVDRDSSQQALAVLQQALPEVRTSEVKGPMEGRREVADRFQRFSWLVILAVFGIGSLIVMTTMMASVNERTREIGIFRAIGFRRTHIMRIILTEAGLVSGASGVVGYITGMLVAVTAGATVADISGGVPWDPLLAVGVITLSVAAGLLASLYPAVKAANLEPMEALRFF